MSSGVTTATTRRRGIDRLHLGRGVRRAHEAGIGLVRQRRVGHEAALAAQQVIVLDAGVALVMFGSLGVHVS
jgi:hypothetical protein